MKKKCQKCKKFNFIEDLNEVFYNEKNSIIICNYCLKNVRIFYCDGCKKLFIYSEVFSEYIDSKELCQFCLEKNKTNLGNCLYCDRVVFTTNGFKQDYQDVSFIYHYNCYVKQNKE